MSNAKTHRILSIDAWADSDCGWTWNNWFHVGDTTLPEDETNEALIARLVSEGFLSGDTSLASVEDDGYNVVICDTSDDMRPTIAIEYGNDQ